MYKLELTEEQLKIHVTGLDSSLRILGQNITNAQSPGLALKNLLPELIKINNQFDFMQAALDAKVDTSSKDPLKEGA